MKFQTAVPLALAATTFFSATCHGIDTHTERNLRIRESKESRPFADKLAEKQGTGPFADKIGTSPFADKIGTGPFQNPDWEKPPPPTKEELQANLAKIADFSAYVASGYPEGSLIFADRLVFRLSNLEDLMACKVDNYDVDAPSGECRAKGDRPPPFCPGGPENCEPPTMMELCSKTDDARSFLEFLELYPSFEEDSPVEKALSTLGKMIPRLEDACTNILL